MNIEEFVSLLKNNLDLKRRDDYIEYGDILDLLQEINSSYRHETSKVIINKDSGKLCEHTNKHYVVSFDSYYCPDCKRYVD